MSDWISRGALGAALLLALGCSEQVSSSIACPDLCTDQSATLRDTVLTGALVHDTTFTGFPLLGGSRDIELVARGDTADVRIIARFDTLPSTFVPPAPQPDSLIAFVDSATYLFRVDTTFHKPTVPVTIEAFDVDTTAADTVPATLLPLFRDDRLIGSATYLPADVKDTLRLPLQKEVVLAKIRAGAHLRIGLRMRTPVGQSASLLVTGSQFQPRVRFRVSADTTVKPDTVNPTTHTPKDAASIASSLLLYPLHAAGALPPPPSDRLALGGIAGARSYLRFDIPGLVLDSVQVIRASLQLTQRPSRFLGGNRDTITVITQPVVAGAAVTDIYTASQFLGSVLAFRVDTLRLVPRDSGFRSVEIVNIVRAWRIVGTKRTPRALVIRAAEEGLLAGELNFFSADAPADLRPRLRLTYVPRRGFGLP
ncbi:MAG: hypothetical protein HOQ19_14270 [Gemmatimonadaceae bacterium]|nr:hypothetical protein [Gemmatimonadaceae bacterium]